MDKASFDYIWDEIIEKTIEKVNNMMSYEDKNRYCFKVRDRFQLKNGIEKDYNSIKNQLKRYYYDSSNEENNDNRIDNHKIAACLCYSLIQNKVFAFDVKNGMSKEMFLSNYKVAYYVGLQEIYVMLLAQYKKMGESGYYSKLLNQGELVVPNTSEGHDEYHEGRIRTLALNDMYGNTFDVLTYSDMMFWIEYYNRQVIEKTIKPISLGIPKK